MLNGDDQLTVCHQPIGRYQTNLFEDTYTGHSFEFLTHLQESQDLTVDMSGKS